MLEIGINTTGRRRAHWPETDLAEILESSGREPDLRSCEFVSLSVWTRNHSHTERHGIVQVIADRVFCPLGIAIYDCI